MASGGINKLITGYDPASNAASGKYGESFDADFQNALSEDPRTGGILALRNLLKLYPGMRQQIAPALDNAYKIAQPDTKALTTKRDTAQQEQAKQESLKQIAQFGYHPETTLYPGNPTQDEIGNALNNNAGFQKQGIVSGQTVTYNGMQYPIENGMANINGVRIDADAIAKGQVNIDDVMKNWGALNSNMRIAPTQAGQNTDAASEARQGTIKGPDNTQQQATVNPGAGTSPEALIQQLIDSVGQGQSQQEQTTREQFAQAQPGLEQAMQAALVKQSGGGRGGLDTGGMLSAVAQQKQKGTVDLNTALSDVAKFYSTLKQNALGQALTGSLNLAQMGQQAGQFAQSQASQNAQNLQQTELQKYLAQLSANQQNKQLSQAADQFAKSFGLQQQGQDWTQQQANVTRQNQLQDYNTQGALAKELANMQPKTPEYSYWLTPLAQAFGTYAGLKGKL